MFFILRRYKDTPDDIEEETMQTKFGFKFRDLQDGFVGDEAKPVIRNEFGNEVTFSRSNFHNKSETEKAKKDKTLQKLGLHI